MGSSFLLRLGKLWAFFYPAGDDQAVEAAIARARLALVFLLSPASTLVTFELVAATIGEKIFLGLTQNIFYTIID